MRRLAIIAILLLSGLHASAQVDSTRLKALDARLEEYFKLLESQEIPVKIEECDALISSASDSLLRQHIALRIHEHYLNSKLMGDEAVAVHMVDDWFLPGKVHMADEMQLMSARIYADFNRQSLIGRKAPSLLMEDPDGVEVSFGGPSDRLRVLFFYDADCAKCKLESLMLKSLLDDKDYPLTLYAIYTGADPSKWESWRESRFTLRAGSTRVINLWDPEVLSDYQVKYGVMQTPRMFLIDRDGTIIGRSLDSDSLERLVDATLEAEFHDYGGPEVTALFDRVFAACGEDMKPEDVLETAAMLKERTLDRGDTLMFKNLEGDLLYYLSSQRGEAFREGSLPFINEYVLSRPDIWNTADDSLRVVGMAELNAGLLSRTPVGSRIPKSRIPGWSKFRRKGGILIFHTHGCAVCAEELAAADSLGLRTFDVDVDEVGKSHPEEMQSMLDTFDLLSLPAILQIGKRGVVRRRYLSLLNNFVSFDK